MLDVNGRYIFEQGITVETEKYENELSKEIILNLLTQYDTYLPRLPFSITR